MQLTLDDATIAYDYTRTDSPLPPVLFLHGALGVRAHLHPVQEGFSERSHVSIDFPSHGESVVRHGTMNGELLARSTLALLDALKIDQVDVIGHSMGGYIGLLMAHLAPNRVRSVVTLGTKFYWTAEAIEMTLKDLDADLMRSASPRFFDALVGLHAASGLDETLRQMQSLITDFSRYQLDAEAVRAAEVPILICTGDRDTFVPVSEVMRLFESLNAKRNAVAVLPNTPHALQHLAVGCFEQSVRRFWDRSFAVKAGG